jgi:membrane-associated phospholipid phosphatase
MTGGASLGPDGGDARREWGGSGLAQRAGRVTGRVPQGHRVEALVRELGDLDRGVYAAVSAVPTPTVDQFLRRLSLAADHSMIWFGVAGASALLAGRRGRLAALDGVVAIGITAAVVNGPLKFALPRTRPDRELHGVITTRQVPLPRTPSFPSGHSASAFAFANAIGGELPWLALPMRFAAAAVAWSRIHTGVHYPGDVIVGGLVGGAVGEAVGAARRRWDLRRAGRPAAIGAGGPEPIHLGH